ncbi:MAG TPA: hypothetical protein VJN02_06105 [Gammaproteobacteria bacterium]|nr:hypothetical protein [Gammaproteobacteria bacterium]
MPQNKDPKQSRHKSSSHADYISQARRQSQQAMKDTINNRNNTALEQLDTISQAQQEPIQNHQLILRVSSSHPFITLLLFLSIANLSLSQQEDPNNTSKAALSVKSSPPDHKQNIPHLEESSIDLSGSSNRFFSTVKTKDSHDLAQLITQKIQVSSVYYNEEKSNTNYVQQAIISDREKYYQVDFDIYKSRIMKALKKILKDPMYRELLNHDIHFYIQPTGIQDKVLSGMSARTHPPTKMILIDMKIIHDHPEELVPILANEIQHLLIITANEQRSGKKLIRDSDKQNFMYHFKNEQEKNIYLQMVEKTFQELIAHINLKDYLHPTQLTEKTLAFRSYFQVLLGYELPLCEKLRHNCIEKGYVNSETAYYRNRYVTDFKLNIRDQLVEFDTSIASIYSLLKTADKKYFQPWVDYHRHYLAGEDILALESEQKPSSYKKK